MLHINIAYIQRGQHVLPMFVRLLIPLFADDAFTLRSSKAYVPQDVSRCCDIIYNDVFVSLKISSC